MTLLPLLAAVALTAPDRPPNVVFLFADDMGWGDAGCYGHPYSKTPNIDHLAADGTRFTQCYATGVTCCPSRTGFLSGKLPATYPTYPAVGGFAGRATVTSLMKQKGYATGHFGKWHIGPDPKAGTYGIDAVGAEDEAKGRRAADAARDKPVYDQAMRFIEANKNRPFYVNVWGHIPHHPVNPGKPLLDAFGPLAVDESKFSAPMREKFAACKARGGDVGRHLRAYLAEVHAMDAQVGRLLAKLDELGLRDNTIVVFSSDQGAAPLPSPAQLREKPKAERGGATDPAGDVRLNAMGYAGPAFRGGKHTQYEGGVRIPFVVRWPGRVPAGRVDEASVLSGADWLPTVCALAGAGGVPADLDGEDASRAWLGGNFIRSKPLLWKTSAPNSPSAIRDGNWKLHHPTNPKRGEVELYDLAADPAEANNVAAKHPDVVERLSAKVEAWVATLPKEYVKGKEPD